MAGGNWTRISEFILMSFSALPTEIQSLLFLVFLIIYLVTLMGNSLIILVTLADPMLHSPMYFFLRNLSFLEIGFFPFCATNKVNHFFCDSPPVLRLVCADTALFEIYAIVGTVLVVMIPCLLILCSYTRIAAAILKIPSAKGKHKAFSTCSSHLLVVSLFYVSSSLTYFRPKSNNSPENKKLLSLSYTVVTPMLNPIIYSLRNNEVKNALSRTFHKALALRICIL
ncbi:PREDICTED: olfactory receptor 10A5 [Chinchilla lanigera]|uniref:olfactory receptor 10A5 n=1 Tax=Chinchilla lanigera TaxID=34839 RepID=UPI000697D749|nr:PREDICTED: olfactory receptor 10A5 [Chinchilla lanigera]